MRINYYQISQDTLNNRPFEAGSLYITTDTNRLYVDPIEGVDRILIRGDYEAAVEEITNSLYNELPNNQIMIDNIATKVPIIKVAEPPEFVNDISECTDTSKMYVLPNSHLCAYMTIKNTTDSSLVPNFTNIYNTANGAYIKDGYRYSHSGGGFVEYETDCSIVVPINVTKMNTTVTLRVRGATLEGSEYSHSIYIGADNQVFGSDGRGSVTKDTDENGDVIITIWVNDPAYAKYAAFHVAAGVDESTLIVTQDEEITYTVTGGQAIPNFTNLFDTANGAEIHDKSRYSSSGGSFKELEGSCAILIPLGQSWKTNKQFVVRVREAKISTAQYFDYVYGRNTETATNYGGNGSAGGVCTVVWTQSGNDAILTATLNSNDNASVFDTLIFNVAEGSVNANNLIVTFNEEISYTVTEGSEEIKTEWTDTGIEYNQPPDYSDRVAAIEQKTAQLANDVGLLENKVSNIGTGSGGMDVFAFASYPPSPQLPGDGSSEADFNTSNVTTPEVYAYMDALWSRYRTYMVKQNLGKDSSNQYDYYRYVFSKAYWRAWYKENYPKMFAWINSNTIIYSESISPRVGDNMYSTPYIGTVYNTVAAVNSETIGVASTRTVNDLLFTRYADGDVEPTIVYTVPLAIFDNYMGRTYTADFAASSGIKEFTHEYIVDSKSVKYFRYPFEDKKMDKSALFPVFILANEHGNYGDSMIPSVVVMRMLKDLCSNTDNLFLRWLKENAIVTVIPVGNPFGGYNNANGVNINRNYDTPGWAGSNTDPVGGTKEDGAFGPYAGSEIETQYIMNTIQQCKAKTAISCHGRGIPDGRPLGEYNSSASFQGCGFDAERMWKVEEALFSMYNFGFNPNGQHIIVDQTSDNYLNAGKSPSYIEYAGAVGGLIEIDDHEVGTLDRFTPLAMEQAYAEVLLVLQNWVEEALEKISN